MTKLNVPEMSCGHCKASVEKAVASVDASASVAFDMENRNVDVSGSLDNTALLAALKSEGYEATVIN
ncbi:MAG: heavy-metal-associated domain-containing protein [Halocynthiibacter sp.]